MAPRAPNAAEVRSAHARLAAYALTHACVDAACAALIFSLVASGRVSLAQGLTTVVLYNLLAFAAQPIVGWPVRDSAMGRRAALLGAMITAAALPVSVPLYGAWPAVALAGLGNAIFHVGGGVVSLRFDPGKTTAPGLFVAPGAAGLAIGIALGKAETYAWIPALVVLLCIVVLWRIEVPRLEKVPGGPDRAAGPMPSRVSDVPTTTPSSAQVAPSPSAPKKRAATSLPRGTHALDFGTVALLLAVVAGRAFVGTSLVLPWKVDPVLGAVLVAAVVAGKAAGGVLADRYGRLKIGVGALIASLPFFLVGVGAPWLGIAGALVFNMTMPVTLVALADTLPERPGFAFGLTCLALIAGALLPLLRLTPPLTAASLTACVALSAVALWLALRPSYRRRRPTLAGRLRRQEA